MENQGKVEVNQLSPDQMSLTLGMLDVMTLSLMQQLVQENLSNPPSVE